MPATREALQRKLRELERRNAEAEPLLRKLASFEKALETTQVGVTIVDRSGRIVYSNPAEAALHGYDSAAELIGQNVRVFAPSELWSPMSPEKLASLRRFNRDSVNLRKDGSTFPVHLVSDLVRDDDGEPIGVVSICQDITERKKAEVELRRAFAELEMQAKASSEELSEALRKLNRRIQEQRASDLEKKKLEAELRQAQKMEAVGLLAGGVAHDFNNILTAIIGYASLISLRLRSDDPTRPDLAQILEAAERGAGLTQQLLTFCRKQIMDLKPLEVNQLVLGVEKFLRRIIGEDITLGTELASEPLEILGDRGQIEQVLINFATNARDAMPGGGRLGIRTERFLLEKRYAKYQLLLEPGDYACISVWDDGTGIDKEHLEQIFEPFFTTKDPGSGTGLGLAVSYGIVKQHQGAISVYSEPGEGSLFQVYLPLVETDQERAEETVSEPAGGSETILVAEDDEPVRRLVATLLREYGYDVLSAADGQAAIDLFHQHRGEVDLALLDTVLPEKNGREVGDEIGKAEPALPILFTSGYTADVLRSKGIGEDPIHFIHKPYHPRDLLNTVRDLLDSAARASKKTKPPG